MWDRAAVVLAGAKERRQRIAFFVPGGVGRGRIVGLVGVDERGEGEEGLLRLGRGAQEAGGMAGDPRRVVELERDGVVSLLRMFGMFPLEEDGLFAAAAVLAEMKLLKAIVRRGVSLERGKLAVEMRDEVKLACAKSGVALRLQVGGQGEFAFREPHAIGPHAVG